MKRSEESQGAAWTEVGATEKSPSRAQGSQEREPTSRSDSEHLGLADPYVPGMWVRDDV